MLGESKVRDLDVTVGTQKNVLRLQVTVDDVEGVEVVECQSDLGSIKLGYRVGETLLVRPEARTSTHLALPEQAEELAACHKVHDHVEVVDVLEGSPQVHKERVTNTDQHLSLRVGVLDLLHLDYLFLAQNLYSIESAVVLGTNKVDTTERSSTQPWGVSCIRSKAIMMHSRSLDRKVRKGVPASSLTQRLCPLPTTNVRRRLVARRAVECCLCRSCMDCRDTSLLGGVVEVGLSCRGLDLVRSRVT